MDEKQFGSSWHDSTIVVKPSHFQLLIYKTVFSRGIQDYINPDSPGRRSVADDWIFGEDQTEHHPGSFMWYCSRLCIDPTKTRARVLDVNQAAEIMRLVREGGPKVDEFIIAFLKGDGTVQSRPEPISTKRVFNKKPKMSVWE